MATIFIKTLSYYLLLVINRSEHFFSTMGILTFTLTRVEMKNIYYLSINYLCYSYST